jgi:alpha-1,6-mannosyltransferase
MTGSVTPVAPQRRFGLGAPRPTPQRTGTGSALRDRLTLAAFVLLVAMLAAIAIGGGGKDSFLVPATRRHLPDSLSGPLSRLGFNMTGAQFFWLLVGAAACYLAMLALGGRLRVSWVVWTIVGLHLIYAIAPPLLSKDIFSYLSYARLGVFHHVNPYLHGPAVAPHDEVYRFVGWRHIPSAYGPLFTAITYPLAYLGPPLSFWTIKVTTALAGLACVALVWRCTEQLGRDPVPAAMWVGLNPIWLIYGIGGAHNDIVMLALTVAGVALLLAGRPMASGVAVIVSAAIKASSVVAVPFMLLRQERPWRELAGIAAGLVAVAVISVAVFGTDVFRLFHILNTQQKLVSGDSIPAQITHLVGLAGVTPLVRDVIHVLEFVALTWILLRVWRGADWIAGIGWAMLVFVVGSSWMLGWYTLWPLPFAAISNDKRLRFATLSLFAYFVVQRWTILLGQG